MSMWLRENTTAQWQASEGEVNGTGVEDPSVVLGSWPIDESYQERGLALFVLFITLHSWERKQLFWSFLSMGLTSEFTYITEHLLSLFFFLILKWNMMSPALFKNIWHSLKIQMLFISRWHYACQCHITCSRNSFLQLCWKFRHQHSIWECSRAGAHKLFSVRGQIISVLGFSGKSFSLGGPYAICQTSSLLSLQ